MACVAGRSAPELAPFLDPGAGRLDWEKATGNGWGPYYAEGGETEKSLNRSGYGRDDGADRDKDHGDGEQDGNRTGRLALLEYETTHLTEKAAV